MCLLNKKTQNFPWKFPIEEFQSELKLKELLSLFDFLRPNILMIHFEEKGKYLEVKDCCFSSSIPISFVSWDILK